MINAISVAEQTTDGLKNLIVNHRKKGATDAPLYLSALRELEVRTGNGLDFDKSLAAIRAAAKQGRCLSYRELSDASEAKWTKVQNEIGAHLGRLLEYAHRMGWPLISAIVVDKPNVKSGKMEPDMLQSFLAAVRDLGVEVVNAKTFLKEQQKSVFAWGKAA